MRTEIDLSCEETSGRRERRRWSDAEKRQIVEESLLGARAGAATARRHGISNQQLWQWRKAWRERQLGSVGGLVPVKLVEETGRPVACGCSSAGRIEIVSANGRRVIVIGAVDVAALVGIVQGLESLR